MDSTTVTRNGGRVLSADIRPSHYNLTVQPDFNSLTFHGTVIIDLNVGKESSSISLNVFELQIRSIEISSDSEIKERTYNEELQIFTITLEQALPTNSNVALKMVFTGRLNTDMVGFYSLNGENARLATTRMAPIFARRVFPCFDEPAFKAEFTVTLIADKTLTCLSNMETASETTVDKTKRVTFARSPLMSTYLLAFVVGDLRYIEKACNPVVRLYAPSHIRLDHSILRIAVDSLTEYREVFGVELPLRKMDIVAIPEFPKGAMENWGLITVHSEFLLGGLSRWTTEIISHEIAHQWFGNLVTLKDWSSLWLIEGFVTFLSRQYLKDSYNYDVSDDIEKCLQSDCLQNARPLGAPLEQLNDDIFDEPTANRSVAFFHMLQGYLSRDNLLRGIKEFIKRHAFKNVQPHDLWSILSETSHKDVAAFAEAWTKHPGYPFITVTESTDTKTVILKQRCFSISDKAENGILYPVPLQSDFQLLLWGERTEIGAVKDFKLNADHQSLFRTLYAPEYLERLIKTGELETADMKGLYLDAMAFAESGHYKTSFVLRLLEIFEPTTHPDLRGPIFLWLQRVLETWMYEDQVVKDRLEQFICKLIEGWKQGRGSKTWCEAQGVTTLGRNTNLGEEVVRDAMDRLERYSNGHEDNPKTGIETDLRIAMKYGGDTQYNSILRIYRKSTGADRSAALAALGVTRDPALIQEIEKLLDEVEDDEIIILVCELVRHRLGMDAVVRWMTRQRETVIDRLGSRLSKFSDIILKASHSPQSLQAMSHFFEGQRLGSIVINGFELAKFRSDWFSRDRDNVRCG